MSLTRAMNGLATAERMPARPETSGGQLRTLGKAAESEADLQQPRCFRGVRAYRKPRLRRQGTARSSTSRARGCSSRGQPRGTETRRRVCPGQCQRLCRAPRPWPAVTRNLVSNRGSSDRYGREADSTHNAGQRSVVDHLALGHMLALEMDALFIEHLGVVPVGGR